VRELRNVLERATIMAAEGLIRPSALGATGFATGENPYERHPQVPEGPRQLQAGQPLMNVEETYIKLTLEHVHGNRKAAAEMLGISLRTLQKRISAIREEAKSTSSGR
jgi:DNA-binding NtrC family response regulator